MKALIRSLTLLVILALALPTVPVHGAPGWPRLPYETEVAAAVEAYWPAFLAKFTGDYGTPDYVRRAYETDAWRDVSEANPVVGCHVFLWTGARRGPSERWQMAALGYNAAAGLFEFRLVADLAAEADAYAWVSARYALATIPEGLGPCVQPGAPSQVAPASPASIIIGDPAQEPFVQIEGIDGDGAVLVAVLPDEADSDTFDPATAAWHTLPRIPGQSVHFAGRVLIRTPADTSVRLRYGAGPGARVFVNTTVTLEKSDKHRVPVSVIAHRLFRGIYEFYWPEGHAGAAEFEVDTQRAVTSIKGTHVTIEAQADGTTIVTVTEGSVEVLDRSTGQIQTVAAGPPVVIGAPSGGLADSGGRFVDRFDGTALDPRWTVVNLNPDSNVGLVAGVGLRLQASGRNGGSDYHAQNNFRAPRVMHALGGDWDIVMRLTLAARNTYGGAGLLLCPAGGPGGNDCWRVAERFFDQGANRVVAATSYPVWNITPSQVVAYAPATVWFRLEKRGTEYTGWYSEDGATWTQHGRRTEARPMLWAGPFAIRQAHDGQIDASAIATVDYYRYEPGGASGTASPPPTERMLFVINTLGVVQNGPPAQPSVIQLDRPQVVTRLRTYHWNGGRGTTTTGTVALRDQSGRVYGPWPTTGEPGQGGVSNAYWVAQVNLTLPAGTYTVIDSDPGTWSYSADTGGRGIVWVYGYDAATRRPSAASE